MVLRMSNRLVTAIPTLVFILSLLGVPGAFVLAQTDKPLKGVADRYWEAVLKRNPTFATSIGDYRYNDRLEDVSQDGRSQWRSTLEGFLRELTLIPADQLSPDDSFTHELLRKTVEDSLLRIDCLSHYYPLDPLDGFQISFPLILVSQPFRNLNDYRAYLVRLRAFPRQVDDHIANMRAGLALGHVSPTVVIEKCVPQIKTHVVIDPTKSEFYAPLQKSTGLAGPDHSAITAELTTAISAYVVPAYEQLLAFVRDEYLPTCRATVGISAVPNGAKIYENLAYLHTGVRIKSDDIHELGIAEVARLRKEMAKIQQIIGRAGGLDEFIAFMRQDGHNRFDTREELIAAADAILQKTKPHLPKLFGRLPKADCVMKEMEAFRAAASPVAYYNPPPEDGSRPGYYYINTYSPNDRMRFTLEALTYHEAVPGHHLQIALDQENRDLPRFRRYGSFTSYVEGWALYSEKLGYDIGAYTDPLQRYGQLTMEMWRACRLVVDTGMHVKGWTRDQAVEYMVKNTSLARLDIDSEIDRYISWPGQALAYKIGEIRISNLRRQAEKELGSKFDIRAFHDALLAGAAMPIEMLEKRMQSWIASRKN
ncbi:MAG: DUF885 domain-containing protein [Planctomycetota bacterium]